MTASAPQQVFLRTSDQEVWGPLTLSTLQIFIENEAFSGPVEVSLDGKTFGFPGEFPTLKPYFPQSMWGTRSGPSMQVLDLPSSADLSQISAIRLYALTAAKQRSGLLQFQLTDRRISVHFRKGTPDHISSTHMDDSLESFLLRTGLLTPEQLARTKTAQASFGGELLGALLGLGMLNPTTIFVQLAQHAKSLLFHAVSATSGSFTFDPQEMPAHKALPLGDRWEVLIEQVRKLPPVVLEPRMAPVRQVTPVRSGNLIDIGDLKLNPHETRAVSYFDGVRSLEKVLADVPNESEVLLRMAFLLRELGILSFGDEPLIDIQKPSAPPPAVSKPMVKPVAVPPPVMVAAPKVASPNVAAGKPVPSVVPSVAPLPTIQSTDIEKLKAHKEKLEQQNHFQVLGVAETADAQAIKVAYFKLAKQYHPDTVPPGAPAEFSKLKASIFARIGESYRVLSDPRSRAEYQEELAAGGQTNLDVAQILAAEEAFQKASILVKNRKFAEALGFLEEALKANPTEGEFYIWRGYARFFTFKDKKQGKEEALQDILHGLSLNERCVAGYYFQGVIERLIGNLASAKKHFQKCVQMQPDHPEAQRELRAMK